MTTVNELRDYNVKQKSAKDYRAEMAAALEKLTAATEKLGSDFSLQHLKAANQATFGFHSAFSPGLWHIGETAEMFGYAVNFVYETERAIILTVENRPTGNVGKEFDRRIEDMMMRQELMQAFIDGGKKGFENAPVRKR